MPWLKIIPIVYTILHAEVLLNKHTKVRPRGPQDFHVLYCYDLPSSFTCPQENQVLPIKLTDGCILYTLPHYFMHNKNKNTLLQKSDCTHSLIAFPSP